MTKPNSPQARDVANLIHQQVNLADYACTGGVGGAGPVRAAPDCLTVNRC
jgi:hypothetical protein